MCQKLSIQFSPPVFKFLSYHFPDGKINLRANSRLGKYILNCVKQSERPLKGRPASKYVMQVKVPAQSVLGLDGRNSFLFFSVEDQQLINDLFGFIMEKELFDRLDLIAERGELNQRNGKQAEEIRSFCSKYSSEEHELKFDTLKKRYQRYKQRSETTIKQEL